MKAFAGGQRPSFAAVTAADSLHLSRDPAQRRAEVWPAAETAACHARSAAELETLWQMLGVPYERSGEGAGN